MEKRIDFKVLLLVYRAMRVRTVRTTVSSQVAVARSRLEGFGNRDFTIAATRLWNARQDLSQGINLMILKNNCLNLL